MGEGFASVRVPVNRIQPTKDRQNLILPTTIGKSPITPLKSVRPQIYPIKIGKNLILSRQGEKRVSLQRWGGNLSACRQTESSLQKTDKNRFSPPSRHSRLFAAELSRTPGKDIHDKIFIVIFHHGDCSIFVSRVYNILIMSGRRNPTVDHGGGGVFWHAVYNGS